MFPLVRCKPCNTVCNRVLTCKKGMGDEFNAAWDEMARDKKQTLMMLVRCLTGRQLRARIEEFLSQEQQSIMLTISDGSTGQAPRPTPNS